MLTWCSTCASCPTRTSFPSSARLPDTSGSGQVHSLVSANPGIHQTHLRVCSIYLIPHYIREGKSYLTIAFGCTGGKHRSVMIAEDVKKRLSKAGYNIKVAHRDAERS